MALIKIEQIDNFDKIKSVKKSSVIDEAVFTIKNLHEVQEMEPWIQAILFDTNTTPHGPVELVDILTHKMSVKGKPGTSALVLKGRSYRKVRPKDVSHQIFRLERIAELSTMVLAASGDILDEVKEQFISTGVRLNCNYSIWDAHDLARLFIAYGYICPRDGEKILGGKCTCGYSPKTRTSNLLQREALEELRVSHSLNHSAAAVILPTGAGKTEVAVRDIQFKNPKRTLYVAHTHEILNDAEREFLRHFSKNEVIKFSSRPKLSDVRKINLITIQSLSRNLEKFHDVDYLVVDEFHHAVAKSYQKTIRHLNPKFLLGLTATPFRQDRKDVLELCNHNVVVDYELRAGIELGILTPYHYYGCFDDVDYSSIASDGKNYNIKDLERALVVPKRNAAIIRKWREKAEGKPTIAFCCSQKHAVRMSNAFNNAGISSEVYLSSTNSDERERIRYALQYGGTKVVCTVDIFNEGIDLPFAECLLFLRPTESKRIFFQQLGRGLRHSVGKTHCTVIDFIGNFKNAYKIVSYQSLTSDSENNTQNITGQIRSPKDIFNLPEGCEVFFDEKVIDLFGRVSNDARFASRQNIGKILIYQYESLGKQLGRKPTKIDIRRNCLLGEDLYKLVFKSWKQFEMIMSEKNIRWK